MSSAQVTLSETSSTVSDRDLHEMSHSSISSMDQTSRYQWEHLSDQARDMRFDVTQQNGLVFTPLMSSETTPIKMPYHTSVSPVQAGMGGYAATHQYPRQSQSSTVGMISRPKSDSSSTYSLSSTSTNATRGEQSSTSYYAAEPVISKPSLAGNAIRELLLDVGEITLPPPPPAAIHFGGFENPLSPKSLKNRPQITTVDCPEVIRLRSMSDSLPFEVFSIFIILCASLTGFH